MRPGFAGPFGDRVVVQQPAVTQGDAQAQPPGGPTLAGGSAMAAPRGRMTDAYVLQMLDVLMRRGAPRTAIVFTHAEETIRHFEVNRGLAQFFATTSSRYRRNAEHSCVLLFHRGTLDDVHDAIERLGRYPGAQRRGAQTARPSS